MLLIREYNCTPSQALHELRQNPWIRDIVLAGEYAKAYHARQEWVAMSDDQRKKAEMPSGRYVKIVEHNQHALHVAAFEEHDDARREAGL